MMKLATFQCRVCTICAVFFTMSFIVSLIFLLRFIILSKLVISLFFILARSPVPKSVPPSNTKSNSFFYMSPLSSNSFPYMRLANPPNTFCSFSLTLPPVITMAIISPISLHARCSLKPCHRPMLPLPSLAIFLNSLFVFRLRLWHTWFMVQSTNVKPIHLPKARRFSKNMRAKNTRLSSSTKRL